MVTICKGLEQFLAHSTPLCSASLHFLFRSRTAHTLYKSTFTLLYFTKDMYIWICIAHLRKCLKCAQICITLCYLKQHHICLYSQSHSITALRLVLIAPTHGGMARLS